jgi:hypothetical protein
VASRGAAKRAAEQVTGRGGRVELPVVGTVTLPPSDQLAFLGGVAALVALGLVDWPVGVLLGVGHLIAADRSNRTLAAFGEALEEA